MINKLIAFGLAVLMNLLSFVILDFNLPVANAGNIISGLSLSAQNEWQVTIGKSQIVPNKLALDLQKNLNSKKNEIGKLAILIVHPHGNYDRTEPIFLAQREGGGSVLEMKIHWHRKMPFLKRNHVTIIDWEILKERHLRAVVVLDDAILSPIHPQELNDLFRELLPANQ